MNPDSDVQRHDQESQRHDKPTGQSANGSSTELSPKDTEAAPLPFTGLNPPAPEDLEPPTAAKVAAVGAVVLSGALGGAIGWGVGEILFDSPVMAALGALLFAVGAATGVGIVAALTLRASSEWAATRHPEDGRKRDRFGRIVT